MSSSFGCPHGVHPPPPTPLRGLLRLRHLHLFLLVVRLGGGKNQVLPPPIRYPLFLEPHEVALPVKPGQHEGQQHVQRHAHRAQTDLAVRQYGGGGRLCGQSWRRERASRARGKKEREGSGVREGGQVPEDGTLGPASRPARVVERRQHSQSSCPFSLKDVTSLGLAGCRTFKTPSDWNPVTGLPGARDLLPRKKGSWTFEQRRDRQPRRPAGERTRGVASRAVVVGTEHGAESTGWLSRRGNSRRSAPR